jgi:hypothetical protein
VRRVPWAPIARVVGVSHLPVAAGTSQPRTRSSGAYEQVRLTDRLDEEKLEILRTWAEGLADDGHEELEAAGKAILMLVEEIELLNKSISGMCANSARWRPWEA